MSKALKEEPAKMTTIQEKAIDAILAEVKKCPEVKAAFLKGSLAMDTADEYSDVDFYCLVDEVSLHSFLDKRVQLLESHRPLLYYSESNFVGPQIVAVFDNGLHFDLYTVTPNRFPLVGKFKVLSDPDNMLERYVGQILDHSITGKQVEEHFESFSFTLLEFAAAWQRGDMAWSTRLASHLAGDLGIVLRHYYDPGNAQLGTKRLEAVLPAPAKEKLRRALSRCSGETVLQGVLELSALMEETMHSLEKESEHKLKWDLFHFMSQRLRSIG